MALASGQTPVNTSPSPEKIGSSWNGINGLPNPFLGFVLGKIAQFEYLEHFSVCLSTRFIILDTSFHIITNLKQEMKDS